MNKIKREDGSEIDFYKLKTNHIYKSWKDICRDLDVRLKTYAKCADSKRNLWDLIDKFFEIKKDDGYKIFIGDIKHKNVNINHVNIVLNYFERFRFGDVALKYIKENGTGKIDFIDFIDSNHVNNYVYILCQYYNVNGANSNIKHNLLSIVELSNKFLSGENKNIITNDIVDKCIYLYDRDVIFDVYVPELNGFNKNVLIHELPLSFNFDVHKYELKKYLMRPNDDNCIYTDRESRHAPPINFGKKPKENKCLTGVDYLLKYCKHIESHYPQNYYIYKYTNKLSNLVYIGITSRLYNRQKERLLSPSSPFDYTLKAIGVDNFEFSIIDYAEDEDRAKVLENKYIDMYDSKNNGYNMVVNKI